MASVGVLGIGLIGGSIAKGLPEPAVVFDSDSKSLELARADGLRVATNLAELVNTVDVLFIGVPFEAFDSVFAEVQAAAVTREKPIVVTNVLSVMLPVAVTEPNVVFIAGHPMAGTEHSGFENAVGGLFEHATWVLAPTPDVASEHFALLANTVKLLGSEIMVTEPEQHNEIVAQISHLPHVLAAAQILAIPEDEKADSVYRLAASSFRDSTRVASTRAELTAAMVKNNRAEVLHALAKLRGSIEAFEELLQAGDDAGVVELFARAKKQRDEHL
jgi:prephenate dehydrogenase